MTFGASDICHAFAKHVRNTTYVMSPRRQSAMNSHELRTVDKTIQNHSPAFTRVVQFRTLPARNK